MRGAMAAQNVATKRVVEKVKVIDLTKAST